MANGLPMVEIEARIPDPNFTPKRDGRGLLTNMDEYYIEETVQAEVLTLNLKKGTMRVMFCIRGEWRTPDVDIAPFLAKYQITEL